MLHRALLILLLVALGACGADSDLATVTAFRRARDAGDHALARTYVSQDPRVWYEQKSGPGMPWTIGEGRWKAWDAHFRSSSQLGPWHVEGDAVWTVATEWNDYYALIERASPARYRLTYFLEGPPDDRRLSGYMISPAQEGAPSPPVPSRFDEFETWALTHHAEEWEYLRPGGRLDPTGDRAARTRALLNEWRGEVGLAPRCE